MMLSALIVDLLAHSRGTRLWTRDVIGSGPRTVGGVLEQQSVSVDLIPGDLLLRNPFLMDNYDVLLISGMVTDLPIASQVISAWRRRRGKRPIIAGGPFSGYAERILEQGVDVVVVGEAEATLQELSRTSVFDEARIEIEELERIRGLMFRKNNRVVYTGPRPPLTTRDLSKFRPSCRLATHYPGYWAYRFYVEVVRGCSNFLLSPIAIETKKLYPGCAYCSVPSYWGPARSIPLDRIVEEVKCLLDAGVTRIVLSGPDILDYGRDWVSANHLFAVKPDDPPPNMDALRKLFKELFEKTGFSGDKNSIIVENVKPVTVNEDTASLLGEFFSGTPINIGVEGGDENLLRRMGRPGALAQAITAVELLAKNGLYPQVYFIYGLPGQDESSLQKTFNVIKQVMSKGADRIILYRFMPLPRTPLEDYTRKEKLSQLELELENFVKKLNYKSKTRIIGRKILGIIASKIKETYIAYPLSHGPVIYAYTDKDHRKSLEGRIVKILITNIHSDRALEGKILTIGKNIRKSSKWENLYKTA
jgi:radical SAM superfamily enzyme YgiQ (UPF0313 family)